MIASIEGDKKSGAASTGRGGTPSTSTVNGAAPPKKKRKILQSLDDNRPASRCASPFTDMGALVAEVQYWQRLRQDLEKARLLCEQIRKREKLKRELVHACCDLRTVQLSPLTSLQLRIIQQLLERDTLQIFAEPVDLDEVKDYSEVVTEPMDLSTMKEKAEQHKYNTIDDLERDFELMISNCLAYNAKDTIFYKAALKLRDQGGSIFSQARRMVALTGFDANTGLLLPQRPKPPPLLTDNAIIKQVDEYLSSLGDDKRADEKELRRLLDLSYQITYHIARNTRVRAIRRRLVALQSGDEEEGTGTATEPDNSAPERDDTTDGEDNIPPSRAIETNKNSANEKVKKEANVSCSVSIPTKDSAADTKGNENKPLQKEIKKDNKKESNKETNKKEPKKTATKVSTTAQKTIVSDSSDEEEEDVNKKDKEDKDFTPPKVTPSDDSGLSLANTPPVLLSTPTTDTRGAGRGRGRGRGRKGAVKALPSDGRQKRIDSFFNKVASPPGTENKPPVDTSQSPPPAVASSSAPPTTEGSSQPSDVAVTPAPRKRGRPFKRGRGGGRGGAAAVANTRATPEAVSKDDPKTNAENIAASTDTDPSVPSQEEALPAASDPQSAATDKPTSDTKTVASKPTEGNSDEKNALGDLKNIVELKEGMKPPPKDSFKIYRSGGEKAPETDDDTHSESTSSLSDSDDESCSDSDSDAGPSISMTAGRELEMSADEGNSSHEIPLEPLDLVWAKCRGYPWYPALIINPKMPRTGYFHNHVPIPVPPQEVLDLAHTCPLTHQYLVLFFDSKRTWQWLPRSKLEPLGERPELDKAKLVESRKPADRKAVKKAYEQAILHRCRVTGDHDGLTGDTDDEKDAQKKNVGNDDEAAAAVVVDTPTEPEQQ